MQAMLKAHCCCCRDTETIITRRMKQGDSGRTRNKERKKERKERNITLSKYINK